MFLINLFEGKNILVGITGGIAAYKTTALVRYLVTQGAKVRVVMTAAAENFISRLTMETLSRQPVLTEMFPENEFAGTRHIHVADQADAAIISPATFNFIGKLNAGIADDLLSTVSAAIKCPVVLAPAMNVNMWLNPVLQRNLANLETGGMLICPPEEGFLAEGYSGPGRLATLENQLLFLYRAIHPFPDSLEGKKVLVTAGRTEEPIDPVRYLSNQSSGKMGFALAWEAFARGAQVTLIHGPTNLPPPVGIRSIEIQTAEQMFEGVKEHFSESDIYLSAAAIADFTPGKVQTHKIKKNDSELSLHLKKTKDVLQFVSDNKKQNQVVVGFAVETESPVENALDKLKRKNLNVIVLNNPRNTGAGFKNETNKVTVFHHTGKRKEIGLQPKIDVSREIFEFILENLKSG